jgi:1-acyl-sn-glycerol-3-phosphate acyltransferase
VGDTDVAAAAALPAWRGESIASIRTRPLPFLRGEPVSRLILRGLMLYARSSVIEVAGLENLQPDRDPFVLVLNHSQRREAVLLPAVMIWHRGGRRVHFWSDWNFQLIPFVGFVLRRSRVITVTAKPARPRFLNVLKPLYAEKVPAFVRAVRLIENGASIGVFPEATVNRDQDRLLPGSPGAARLSLTTGAPIVPGGILFPDLPPGQPVPDHARMAVRIGSPIHPPAPARPGRPDRDETLMWHARIMQELARTCGKQYTPPAPRR